MHSSTSIPLEHESDPLGNDTMSVPAVSNKALTIYQKATLQAMGIVLYERRGAVSVAESLELTKSNDVVESTHSSAFKTTSIDESDLFIKQLFSIFNVSNSAELGLSWQVHDEETIMLKDNILITPDAKRLKRSDLKKQLWGTLRVFFKTKEWS